MNALITQDSLNIQQQNAFHNYASILLNSFLIIIVLDYIVHRFQIIKKINLFEKKIVENNQKFNRACSTIEENFNKRLQTPERVEKGLEEHKIYINKILSGLCSGIDDKLLCINFQIQDGIDAIENKLKILVNSELDKVDDSYDKLSRNLLLLQSKLSESCENNSDRMTKLEETLNENYPHISLLTDKIETFNQFLEVINKNVFKVDQKYYELKEMMTKELDEIQQFYLSLYDELDKELAETTEKMNEWTGSKLDSKICDLYCCINAAISHNQFFGLLNSLKFCFPNIDFDKYLADNSSRIGKSMYPNSKIYLS